MSVSMRLRGDMLSGLSNLTNALSEETLRSVGVAGAKVIQNEAITRVPVRKGIIRRNIIIKRAEEKSSANRQTYLVTVRKGRYGGDDAFYWRFVEEGHKYVPRRKKGKSVNAHRLAAELEYGTSKKGARPFMRPAYEATKEQAVEAMRQRLRERLALIRGK